jgi:molybdenum cofactor biosynthesis enzyme MoaA
MTGLELENKEPQVNWRNFRKACTLAQMKGVTTILITGKGEPTLFPDQITSYLNTMENWDMRFPFIELQTNGRLIANDEYDQHLSRWYDLGLSTVALSVVHWEEERNQEIYQFAGGHYDLRALTEKLHNIRTHGFSVRLTLMMLRGYIDNPDRLIELVCFCKAVGIEQLTIRSISHPDDPQDNEAYDFVAEKGLAPEALGEIKGFLEDNGKRLRTLPHGATVYDFDGQNVCLANCLTIEPEGDDLRQLIFFPDGHLRHDWQYKGAVLL